MRDTLPTRNPRLPAAAALGALLGTVLLGTGGCGPSQLAKDYDAYVAVVEPMLEQETERATRLDELYQARRDDLASPPYFDFVQGTAIPFYTDLRERLAAVQPRGERVAEAHRDLLRFAEARLEFLHVEASSRDIFAGAMGDGGVLDVFSGMAEAESLRYEYMSAVGQDVPDAILGELYTLMDTFRRRHFDPLQQGAKDPDEVRLRLTSHVIPRLVELTRRKYGDDDRGRKLKACVNAWLRWARKVEAACPTLQRIWQAKAQSQAAAEEADAAFRAFREKLAAIRRDR